MANRFLGLKLAKLLRVEVTSAAPLPVFAVPEFVNELEAVVLPLLVTDGRIRAAMENRDAAVLSFRVCVGTTVSSSATSGLSILEP